MTDHWAISVPGRVNLIGEHIDYHDLPVLPMAIQRRIVVDFDLHPVPMISAESRGFGMREVSLDDSLKRSPAGDWANYIKAAIKAVTAKWQVHRGFRAKVRSDLPSAAGLSSSSALLTAFTLGLLRANEIEANLDDLMSVLPEAEHFVGTRGGGMDHAAVLASRTGQASLVRFAPFEIGYVPVPDNWCFLLAHSLTRAEKSGAAKARYNACRTAGRSALAKYGFASFQQALLAGPPAASSALSDEECQAFTHAVSEANRVSLATEYLVSDQRPEFGKLLLASHASLRDRLRVSCQSLDSIVEIAQASGADGARLTGAGFGGCAIILCTPERCETIIQSLERDFYSGFPEYRRPEHLILIQPSNGALHANDN